MSITKQNSDQDYNKRPTSNASISSFSVIKTTDDKHRMMKQSRKSIDLRSNEQQRHSMKGRWRHFT
ncbi:hypothetical protein DERF_000961 [Dermatophagoides farinae]|uniref:Uncharacterized protein n=1 Tax=Dermatophagoides farinae TaxID=6954 RepID=A0A922IB98_DERFA|nr:hypothetical protein DERF_000961 [Dermatophagoides farinae]